MATIKSNKLKPSRPSGKPEYKGISDATKLRISPVVVKTDFVTVIGLFLALSLIASALLFGNTPMAFFNIPALLIVLGGTCAVTAISYSSKELKNAANIFKKSVFHRQYSASSIAGELLDMACVIRAQGPLSLSKIRPMLKQNPDIYFAAQLIIDDFEADQMHSILKQNVTQQVERHKMGIGILRRAADVAPAMGLIGTLVGLVQMLSQLSNPESIGPAMAIALLTTFYGAVLGTVILSPMAAKLERNSADEIMVKDMIMQASMMIMAKEHPRKIETFLNTLLPPSEQIRYFD